MTEVSGTSSSASTTGSSSYQSLVGSYELFLSLLTTQIQNQDPLDPLDSAEYTNQLVQYSSVEQSIQSNEYLKELVTAMQTNQASSYVSYLGSEVTASGDTSMLQNGSASWSYQVSDAATGTVEIRNSGGAVVYQGDVELSAGSGTYRWDGVTDNGTNAPNGAYSVSFSVSDSSGNAETVSTEFTGIVDEVDLSGSEAFLRMGDISVPVSSVKSVRSIGS